MGFDAFLAIVALVAFVAGWTRIRRLERDVADLRLRIGDTRVATDPIDDAISAERPVARVVAAPLPEQSAEPPPIDDRDAVSAFFEQAPDVPAEPPTRAISFESLVGGRLPIWVGGAALVVAGFFLVRLSIESGLFGPGARVAVAALFSAALIAGGEIARRLPAVRDDIRVAQVLTGAGIASAYGTLYIAAATYHLIGAGAAFVLMVAVTSIALALALRHGPPTAVMALIGGFSAPLLAGSDAPDAGPLLAYLAVFIAALLALAAHRGWRWLAWAALVAGFGWANLLVLLIDGRDVAGVGAFVVLLAIAGTLALPRAESTSTALRVAPLVAGLLQLLVLAPVLDFGPLAWMFHLMLGGATLVLAWRDPRLLPAAVIAAALVTVLVALGLSVPDVSVTPIAAIVGTVLFAGSGLALARRASLWSAVALIGLAGPVIVAHALAVTLLAPVAWTTAELLGAALAAMLAWQHRGDANMRSIALVGGSVVAALLAGVGFATLAGSAWAPLALTPVLLAGGWWATRVADADIARLPVAILVATVILAASPLAGWITLVGHSVFGTSLTYPLLPPLGAVVRQALLPAAAAAALFAWPISYGTQRRRVAVALAVVAGGILYTLAKQPLAIADPARFIRLGFIERAAITAISAAAGWALAARTPFRRTALVLVGIAAARLFWFDLLILNPVLVRQHVGGLPLLNAAVLLPTLLAAATWTIGRSSRWRSVGLAFALLATAAAVRQIAHGTNLTGGLGNGENWGFSAAFLALAVAWLWRGLATGSRLLRIAALALLTAVTVKVFLIDVAALGGVLRILSLLGLGLALIGIGWTYNRVIARPQA